MKHKKAEMDGRRLAPLRIMGDEWDVAFKQETIAEDLATAQVRLIAHKMTLGPGASEQCHSECILHEIIEIINHRLKLKMDHDKCLVPLSSTLYGVIRDNPEWFAAMSKGELLSPLG